MGIINMPKSPKSTKKSAKGAKGAKGTGGKRKKKPVQSYNSYIYKVLKQVHPDTGISKRGMSVMNSFINDIKESNSQNKEKLKVLAHKTALIEEVFMQAAEQCKFKAGDAQILQGLIKQGMQSFSEGATIKVSCRKQDDGVVQSAMAAVSGKLQKDPRSIEKSHACTLMPTLSECLGGVILSNGDNTVIVDQTFNARLNVCMERAIPIVKPILFGEGGSKHLI